MCFIDLCLMQVEKPANVLIVCSIYMINGVKYVLVDILFAFSSPSLFRFLGFALINLASPFGV